MSLPMHWKGRAAVLVVFGVGMFIGASPVSAQQNARLKIERMPAPTAAMIATEEKAVLSVLDAFKAAIKGKNITELRALFYKGDIRWFGSGHNASRHLSESLSGKQVEAVEPIGAYQAIQDTRFKDLSFEERTYGPQVKTDGQVATLTFDYDFRVNGVVQNWGTETWQLIRAPEGWRILQLLYSYHLQLVTPSPERAS